MKTVAIVQARMGSTRLPKKVMLRVCEVPLLGLLLARLANSTRIDQIVIATTLEPRDDVLVRYAHDEGYVTYRGSEEDVLDRYYQAACMVRAETIVRITADCPLIDPALVDLVVQQFTVAGVDYASNIAPPTYPDGLDTEVFSFAALEIAWRETNAPEHREHVTPFLRESSKFTKLNVVHPTDNSRERWTVDRPEDFEVVRRVYEYFHPRIDFGWLEVMALCQAHPEWFQANRHLIRNEALSPNVDPSL